MNRDTPKCMLEPLPDREEFESEIRDLLNDGDITHTARYLHLDRTALSKMLNPQVTERHNPFWLTLGCLWAFDARREGLADHVVGVIERRRMLWLPPPVSKTDPARSTANIVRELSDLIEKELKGCPDDELLKEAKDIAKAVEIKVDEILSRRGLSLLRRAA